MATFKICVFEHQLREDGTFPVSIRVTWKRKSAYIKTEYRVVKKQLTKDLGLKDAFLLRELNNRIAEFEELKVKRLGVKIEGYTAKELADYFTKQISLASSEIDFIGFGRQYAAKQKPSYQRLMNATLNALVDFAGREKIFISEITSRFLTDFEKHLKTPRKITRLNQFRQPITTTEKASSDLTIRNYTSNIRTIFNAAIEQFNDEEKGDSLIMHYPFKKYKVKPLSETRKRNLSLEQIRQIINIEPLDLPTDRARFARDIFLLSFFLVGMNTVDLYEMPSIAISNGRITYRRTKTTDRRQDGAEISIKIESVAHPLIEKFRAKNGPWAFVFKDNFSDSKTFVTSVNKGLKLVAERLGWDIPLTTYYARHSWATIARNDCRISKDDVHLALNHVDDKTKITDIYIARDWSIVDDANRKVVELLSHNKISTIIIS